MNLGRLINQSGEINFIPLQGRFNYGEIDVWIREGPRGQFVENDKSILGFFSIGSGMLERYSVTQSISTLMHHSRVSLNPCVLHLCNLRLYLIALIKHA